MLPKDYVRLRLTGEWAIDAADASGTLLFDVARRRWSDEVLDALELPRDWFPPVLESPERAGVAIARDERRRAVPVAAGAGDQPAAALGVGIDRPGPVSVVLGTSGVVLAALPGYAHDPEGRVHAFCHAVPGTWQAMGVMLSAAGSLEWLHERLAPDDVVRRSSSPRRRRGRPGPRGCCSRRTWPGSARPMRTRTRAAPSSGSSCATTAARSCGRCSRASPSA